MKKTSIGFWGLFVLSARVVFSDVPLPTDDPARWRPNPDGGDAPAVSAGVPCDGQPSLRFAYVNGRGYGNSLLDRLTIPPDAYGVRFRLRVEAAAPEAVMHLWFREKDGDMWMCPITPEDDKAVAAVKGQWRDVFVPFSALRYQPRGDKKRHFLSSERMLMGFNFGNQTVCVAGLSFAVRTSCQPPAEHAAPTVPPEAAAGRRIAILREPTVVRQPGHADPERLARLLRDAGFSPVFLRAADLCDRAWLNRQRVDLLVLPNAPFFPRAAVAAFRAYLKAGGAFFSIGGYAFDQLGDYGETGWTARTLWPAAREIDHLRRDAGYLNTRYGTPGDTMKLSPDQIGVFDPSFLLRHVASVSTAADQYAAPETWRADLALEGPAAIAMTGSNSPVFPDVNARWIPLLETFDRLGRPRGPAAALVLNYRGPYAKSNWGFIGVTNRDLFNGDFPAMDRLFVATCRRLLAPAYLMTLKSGFASYRPGETAALTATVQVPAEGAYAVRFRIDGATVAETAVTNGHASATWHVAQPLPDFHSVSAELLADGRPVDIMRSGFCVWNPAGAEVGPRLALRDNYFVFNDRPLFFGGANTTGMMWYSDNEDPLVWRRDFERMGDFAMNTLRILHFSPFANATNPVAVRASVGELVHHPEKTCRQTDAIVQLAQPNQVTIFLSLHDWIPLDLSGADLQTEQAWDRFWAGRYRGFHGMLYDIQNEPATRLTDTAVLRPLYEKWLAAKYGALEAAFNAWRGSGAKPEVDFQAKPSGWDDLRVRDNERFRAWVYARWQRANGEAVKAAAPDAPVTVGHLQNLTASEKVLDTAGVDFVNIHHYGAVDHLRSVLKHIDRRFEGKSFSLGEFGSRVAHTARNRGEWGDPSQASVTHFLAVGHYALGMGASFVANWSWKDFRDCVFPWGVNHADLTPKPVIEAYRNMMLLFRTAEPRYEPPHLYLMLPDSFRIGPESGRIHEGLRRAVDWLLGANVPFGVINETSLDRLPAGAQALVWPLAVCPEDAAFDRVAQFVRGGGRLLLTGDPRFGEDRKPTRLERLAALGLPAVSEPPVPPFTPQSGPLDQAAFRLSADGRVAWLPMPIELLDGTGETGRALYKRFLDDVSGVARLRVDPDDGSVLAFDVALRNGHALVAVNAAETARQVTVSAHGAYPEISAGLAAGRTLYVMLDGASNVLAAAAQDGVNVAGRPVLRGAGDCAFLALDRRDLRCSEQVAAMPFGAGPFALDRAADAPALAGEVGEFRAGTWTVLERQRLAAEDGAVSGGADAATGYDLRLFAGPGRLETARENLSHLLRVQPLKTP